MNSPRWARQRRDVAASGGQASWSSGVINLLKTVLGSGMLAMPLALSRMGVTLGTIVVFLSAFTAGFGLYLQVRCAQYLRRGESSFFALSQLTYPNLAVVFDGAIAVKCFGVAVSYMIIIGDLMPGLAQAFAGGGLDEGSTALNRQFWITAAMLVIVPLCFLRRLDSLKYTSIIGLISISYLAILVIAHYLIGDAIPPNRDELRLVHWAGFVPALKSFPVFVFAYTCHQNMFSVLNESADPSPLNAISIILTSIGFSSAVYLCVSLAGYFTFGNAIEGNIVGMYAASFSSTVARAAIISLVLFSIPLQIYPSRASLDSVLRWKPKGHAKTSRPSSSASNAASTSPHRQPLLGERERPTSTPALSAMSGRRFGTLTVLLLVLAYITAMSVSSLEAVLAYVGSTGSTAISFILPGLFYYKISAPDSEAHQRLMKADDDESAVSDEEGRRGDSARQQNEGNDQGPQQQQKHRSRSALRGFALALTIYGVIVMSVCITLNVFFN